MDVSPACTVRKELRAALRLEFGCTFAAVQQAAQAVRAWLASQEFAEAEVAAWELVLIEAGNNAVEHAPASRRSLPLGIELSCGPSDVEARVTDHTHGFEFPERVELPGFESEGSRGLFLIQSLTDHVEYWRGRQGNTLVLRKKRPAAPPPETPRRTGPSP